MPTTAIRVSFTAFPFINSLETGYRCLKCGRRIQTTANHLSTVPGGCQVRCLPCPAACAPPACDKPLDVPSSALPNERSSIRETGIPDGLYVKVQSPYGKHYGRSAQWAAGCGPLGGTLTRNGNCQACLERREKRLSRSSSHLMDGHRQAAPDAQGEHRLADHLVVRHPPQAQIPGHCRKH